MKKKNVERIFVICAAVSIILLAVLFMPEGEAHAADDTEFSYSMNSYSVSCVLKRNCSAEITETISFAYVGGKFTRTIPVSGGVRIKKAKLAILEEDGEGNLTETNPGYRVTSDGDGVTIEAKRSSDYEPQTFRITYTLANLALTETDYNEYVEIPLASSFTSGTVRNVSLSLILPSHLYTYESDGAAGFMASLTDSTGTPSEQYPDTEYSEENLTLSLSLDTVPAGGYVNFRLFFGKGVLHSGTGDILPWLLLLIIAATAAAAAALKFTVFAKTKSVSAPSETSETGEKTPPIPRTDPLAAKRILNGRADDKDAVTLLMYWAERGYIKIDVKNEGNPVFVRVAKRLPPDSPDSWNELFSAIFSKSERAGLKSVATSLLPAMKNVERDTNKKKEVRCDRKSMTAAFAAALAASLFSAFMPAFLPMRVSAHAVMPVYLAIAVPALLVFGLTAYTYVTRGRRTKTANTVLAAAAALVAAACAILYIVLIPGSAYPAGPRIICALLWLAATAFAASCVTLSTGYVEKISEADEIKSFVKDTDKEELHAALEKDAGLYYRYLPYARVFRVGAEWSEKFSEETMSYPEWIETDRPSDRFSAVRETIRKTFDTIYRRVCKKG